MGQKRTKFLRTGAKSIPILPTSLVTQGQSATSGAAKLVMRTKGVIREAHARNLWYAAVVIGCERATFAVNELLSRRKARSTLTQCNEGWRYIFDKMAST